MLGFGEQSREIEAVCARISSDFAIRTVVLTGAGRSFCAGGDIKSMVDQSKDSSCQPIDDRYFFFSESWAYPRLQT